VTVLVVWSDDVTRDMLTTAEYIAARNLAAAQRLIAAIRHTAETLPDHLYLFA